MSNWRYGTVNWFDVEKGFGFIDPGDAQPQVFVEYTSIEMSGLRTLLAGEPVAYTHRIARSGPEAVAVRPLPQHGLTVNAEAHASRARVHPVAGGDPTSEQEACA
ncbi:MULTISPECIES: cold shock domain-containing protein [Mycobacteriaceae]|uniref:Cold shock domain-containing protein n=1 Tax=Mycolicibacterium austroafricanum TaxID=39687 RepID=A0ABT8H8X7_MYCAO|nr:MULTISPECIES: cold shock domain-containing protein [Mycobacteriaceae]MDN4517219.1 cold shock domain-containing protein [Mycolicibacterium austroafricanum]